MLDRSSFWTPVSEQDAGLSMPRLRVTVVPDLFQLLLSGDPNVIGGFLRETLSSPVGFNGLAIGNTYAAAVGRDRTLIVSNRAFDIAEGWNESLGIATTVMDDAWTVLDLQGEDLDDVVSMATTIERGDRTPSSALLFAGIPSFAYRYGSTATLRMHVERPIAAFVLEWIRRSAENGCVPQS